MSTTPRHRQQLGTRSRIPQRPQAAGMAAAPRPALGWQPVSRSLLVRVLNERPAPFSLQLCSDRARALRAAPAASL